MKFGRSFFLKIARPLFSVLIVFLILQIADKKQLYDTLKNTKLSSIVVLCALYSLGQLISAIKWKVILENSGVQRKSSAVFKSYFMGMFVNTAGFGTVGGDLFRALALIPKPGERTRILTSVAADRVHGLVVLLCLGLFSLGIFHTVFIPKSIWISALVSVFLLPIVIMFSPKLLVEIFPKKEIFQKLDSAVKSAFPNNLKTLLLITVLSLISHALQVYMHFLIISALSAKIAFKTLLASIPFVNAFSALPLSYNGLGVREGLFLLLFVPMFMSKEEAIATGAIWFLSITLVNLSTGFLWVFSSKGVRKAN